MKFKHPVKITIAFGENYKDELVFTSKDTKISGDSKEFRIEGIFVETKDEHN